MKKIGIFYGSSTGNTEYVSEIIANKIGDRAELYNVDSSFAEDLDQYEYLIFGTSTWGVGDAQDDWEDYFDMIKDKDLKGKTIAIFGLGDQDTYPDSFVDGMGLMYDFLKKHNANIIGSWPVEGYNFSSSLAVKGKKFVGLVLDMDYQEEFTEKRIDDWLKLILKEMK